MLGSERVKATVLGLFSPSGKQAEEGHAEDEDSEASKSDTGSVRIRQKILLCPGDVPGLHKLVNVTEGAVEKAVDIGIGLPGAVIEHARQRTDSEAPASPQAGASETAPTD